MDIVSTEEVQRDVTEGGTGGLESKQVDVDVCRLAVVVQMKCIYPWPCEPSWHAEVQSSNDRWGRWVWGCVHLCCNEHDVTGSLASTTAVISTAL